MSLLALEIHSFQLTMFGLEGSSSKLIGGLLLGVCGSTTLVFA